MGDLAAQRGRGQLSPAGIFLALIKTKGKGGQRTPRQHIGDWHSAARWLQRGSPQIEGFAMWFVDRGRSVVVSSQRFQKELGLLSPRSARFNK